MMQSNPILEAFGNAKTTRNNNSSRFGKFMEIEFDALHMICSGKVETYLLEKSRIVQHQQNERSYHSFYQLCAGAPPELRTALKLGAPEGTRCLLHAGSWLHRTRRLMSNSCCYQITTTPTRATRPLSKA